LICIKWKKRCFYSIFRTEQAKTIRKKHRFLRMVFANLHKSKIDKHLFFSIMMRFLRLFVFLLKQKFTFCVKHQPRILKK